MIRWAFLALAIWGTIHPMWYFIAWFQAHGWSLGGLIDSWYVHAGTSGLVWDLTIAALALTLWIIVDVRARRDWLGLIAIPAIFGIGVSCGLPLYIFLRMRNRQGGAPAPREDR